MSEIFDTIGDVWDAYADGSVGRAMASAPTFIQVGLAVVLALFVIAAAWWLQGRIRETVAARTWDRTTATVENVTVTLLGDDSSHDARRRATRSYRFDYAYSARGRIYRGSGKSLSDAVVDGQEVTVWVSPRDASVSKYVARSELGLNHRGAAVLYWAGLLAAVLFFVGLFVASNW